MRIVFFSYRGTIGARCLRWLLDQPKAEVAAVVTYVRNSWSNSHGPVSVADVEAAR
jgi:methionyl-tRNA formyltransferase